MRQKNKRSFGSMVRREPARLSLNVASGFTQLISLAQAGFFGVGAYTTAILATRYNWPLWVNLPLGMAAAGLVALPVGLVALRTVEDYFITDVPPRFGQFSHENSRISDFMA